MGVHKHHMEDSSVRKVMMRDGRMVAEVYSKGYLKAVRRTFRQLRT
jgi:hypothetical protein